MKAPGFWWQQQPTFLARALAPIGSAVGGVAARRMARPPVYRSALPVICVGNPTVGGSGKTPIALALAALARQLGKAPVFLSRGYGGTLAGPVAVSANHTSAEVGDEPLLLSAEAPTVVSRDRAAGARLAETLGDVIVMDDGFQNPSLAKTLSLLVIDQAVGIGNGLVTPAGPMRAPFASHLAHADAVVLVDNGEPQKATLPDTGALRTFGAHIVPSAPQELHGVAVLAFAGIGRPEKLFHSATALGASVRETRRFGDHERIGEADARSLLRAAETGLTLVTTTKDAARLKSLGPNARKAGDVAVPITVTAELSPSLSTLLANVMGAA